MKTLYHGTNNEELVKTGFLLPSQVSSYGKGYYFHNSVSAAAKYGRFVLKFEVDIGTHFNPLDNDNHNKMFTRLVNKYRSKGVSFPVKNAAEEIHRMGYDSLRFRDFSISRKPYIAFVVFDIHTRGYEYKGVVKKKINGEMKATI